MRALPVALAVALVGASPSFAAVITFNDRPEVGNEFAGDILEGGIHFLSDHMHVIDEVSGRLAQDGSKWIGSEVQSAAIAMAPDQGGTFSLLAIDVSEFWATSFVSPSSIAVDFFGETPSGSITRRVFLDRIADGTGPLVDFQHVAFAGWNNLTSVRMAGVTDPTVSNFAFGIDNVQVSTAASVPETRERVLLVAGLGAAGVWLRGRRNQAQLYWRGHHADV